MYQHSTTSSRSITPTPSTPRPIAWSHRRIDIDIVEANLGTIPRGPRPQRISMKHEDTTSGHEVTRIRNPMELEHHHLHPTPLLPLSRPLYSNSQIQSQSIHPNQSHQPQTQYPPPAPLPDRDVRTVPRPTRKHQTRTRNENESGHATPIPPIPFTLLSLPFPDPIPDQRYHPSKDFVSHEEGRSTPPKVSHGQQPGRLFPFISRILSPLRTETRDTSMANRHPDIQLSMLRPAALTRPRPFDISSPTPRNPMTIRPRNGEKSRTQTKATTADNSAQRQPRDN